MAVRKRHGEADEPEPVAPFAVPKPKPKPLTAPPKAPVPSAFASKKSAARRGGVGTERAFEERLDLFKERMNEHAFNDYADENDGTSGGLSVGVNGSACILCQACLIECEGECIHIIDDSGNKFQSIYK